MWRPHSTALEIVEPFPLLVLPDLVLQHVLVFLTRLERKAVRVTCRKLCKVASAAVTHFHLDAGIGAGRHYLRLHQRFPNVQVVSFSNQLATDADFAALVVLTLSRWKSLVAVDLQEAHLQLSAGGLCSLLTCRQLRQVLLTPPAVDHALLPEAHNQAIIQTLSQLPCLTHLLLLPQPPPTEPHTMPTPDWALGPASLEILCQQHSLVQLELGCSTTLTSLLPLLALTCLRQLSLRRLPRQAAGSLQQLSRLESLVSLSLSDSTVGDESLEMLGALTGLTELLLLGCPRLTEACLPHLSPCSRLLVLRVPGLTVGEAGLLALMSGPGQGLRALEVEAIATNLPGYHGHLPLLTHLGLARLTSAAPQLSQLAPRLSSLVVTGGASDAGVTRALTGHAHLQRLGLCCTPLTDAGLSALTYLSQLTELGLAQAHLLGGERLVAVLGRFPQLKVLQLTEALELSDVVLARLLLAAPQLQALGLQECHLLSEEGWALLPAFQHLQHLWVDSCSGATPGVLTAVAACRALECLELHRVPGVTPHHVQLLGLVKGPKLDIAVHAGKRPMSDIFPLQSPAREAGGLAQRPRRGGSDAAVGLRRAGSLGQGGELPNPAAAAGAGPQQQVLAGQIQQQQQQGALGVGGQQLNQQQPGQQQQQQQVQEQLLPQAFGALVLDAQGAAIQ